MPLSVQRLADEPIIIITFEGAVDANIVAQVNPHIQQLLMEKTVNSALIFDTTTSQANFKDIFGILQFLLTQPDFQATSEITVLSAFVGTSAMIKLYVDAARQKQFGGQQFPLFARLDDAITAMRTALSTLPAQKQVE